jgi:hypothetical protein
MKPHTEAIWWCLPTESRLSRPVVVANEISNQSSDYAPRRSSGVVDEAAVRNPS